MGHYLALGVPCVGLLNVKQLCAEYGLPFDPAALEKVGQSHIYYEKAYPRALLLVALALTALLLAACRRIDTRNPETDPSL